VGPIGLSGQAWGTLIITSAIFYGGFVYYTLIGLQIDPKTLPQRLMAMANPEYVKKMWRKDQKTRMMMAGGVAFMLLVVAMLAGFGGYEAPYAAPGRDVAEEDENDTTTLVMVVLLDQTGVAGIASPGMEWTAVEVPFDVAEGGKILMVNLSCVNPRAATDYDLVVYGPDGKNVGQSAGPDAEEQVIIETRGNRTLAAGTYTAKIVFFLDTVGTTWHLEVTAWYMQFNDVETGGE